MNETMKRAYVMLHLEIASWQLKDDGFATQSIIGSVISSLKGQKSNYVIYNETKRLILEAKKILQLTDISVEDLILVLEQIQNDFEHKYR